MTDFCEIRRAYESRKVHRFLQWMDTATFYLAIAAMACGAIIVISMISRIAGRG